MEDWRTFKDRLGRDHGIGFHTARKIYAGMKLRDSLAVAEIIANTPKSVQTIEQAHEELNELRHAMSRLTDITHQLIDVVYGQPPGDRSSPAAASSTASKSSPATDA